jgi:hypothetical protein
VTARAALPLLVMCLSCRGVVEPAAEDAGASTPDAGPALDAGGDSPADAGGRPSDAGTAPVDAGPPQVVYLAGGQDLRRVLSHDGSAWGQDTYVPPTGLDNAFGAIAVGNGIIVGVADTGIFTSADGVQWSKAAAPAGVNSLHSAAGIFAGGKFVFVSSDSSYTSGDGLTWQSATDASQGVTHWHHLSYGNGHYVAFGDSAYKVSEDGLLWHDFVSGATVPSYSGSAFANGYFVATGGALQGSTTVGHSARSTDGVTWTDEQLVSTLYNSAFGGVAWGSGLFVTSDCCNAYTSVDGKSWSKQGSGFNGGSVAYAGGRFVAVEWRTNILTSADGTGFTVAFHDDGPNQYPDAGQAPWLTTIGAGTL